MIKKHKYPIPAFYIHNGGDREPLHVNGTDGKGNAWVTWKKDGFKNMVPESRLDFTTIKGQK
jgi:hypothetical protein